MSKKSIDFFYIYFFGKNEAAIFVFEFEST